MKLSSLLTGTSSDPSFGPPAQIFPRKVKIARPVRKRSLKLNSWRQRERVGTLSRVDEDVATSGWGLSKLPAPLNMSKSIPTEYFDGCFRAEGNERWGV